MKRLNGHLRGTLTKSLLLASAFLLSACESALIVKSDFPKPVVQPIDITMGVVYTDELTKYTYSESEESRSKWKIGIGEAHQHLFEQVFEKMFTHSESLTSLDENNPDYDLVLLPSINEFQYSSPKETRSKIYEVWIRYNMQVYSGNGELVADWIMSAYGKTPSAFLKSREEAMNQAIIVALRDLGASLTTGFARVPEVKSWLANKEGIRSNELPPNSPKPKTDTLEKTGI